MKDSENMNMKDSENKGRPVLWRHHMAGVLLGWIRPSDVPGHISFDGVRIWSWSGGRTDCASLATHGPRDGDRITERVRRDVAAGDGSGSTEIYDTDERHVLRGIQLSEGTE